MHVSLSAFHLLLYEMKLCVIKLGRLTNEQRSSVAEYFRVYKVVFLRAKLWFILLVSAIVKFSEFYCLCDTGK